MTAKIISIQRYYEYGTGTYYLSSSWTDFFGSGICTDIIIKVYEAQSKKTGNWVKVLSSSYGVGSLNCYAEIKTNVQVIPSLETFRIGCINGVYNNNASCMSPTICTNPNMVYSNNFKLAIIKFCGSSSKSYIDQIQKTNTYPTSGTLTQDLQQSVEVDIKLLFKFSDLTCATSDIVNCQIVSYPGTNAVTNSGTVWQLPFNTSSFGTLYSNITCTSKFGGVIVSYLQKFNVIKEPINCTNLIHINGIPEITYQISAVGVQIQNVTSNGSYASTNNSINCPLSYSLQTDFPDNIDIDSTTGIVFFLMPESAGTFTYQVIITTSNGVNLTSVVNTIIVKDCSSIISIKQLANKSFELSQSGVNYIISNDGSYAVTTKSVDCPITYSLTEDSNDSVSIDPKTGVVTFQMPLKSGILKY